MLAFELSRVDSAFPRPLPLSPSSPVPLVTRQDLGSHLESLREYGWHFLQKSKRYEQLGYTATWWELRHSGLFPSFKVAINYINDVAALARAEKHHPTILVFDRVHVEIGLDTHDTIERPAMDLNSSDSDTVVARWPGITLRDIRMALLINPLLDQHKVIERSPSTHYPIPRYEDLIDVRVDKFE
ncbi:hypothetical protein RSOLAG1IB_09941 [Rhizoctonia solani AG-1 IB]|uniref:4a-hydroxytetrahydrobiopterin dehydratase n=1 Tax=Thanatephorus cucumeris (strain AG1-IB / isolate 7/3/14) TaxID=1108050 RepID=A0A0B7FYK9_THACB|nr:hypothetical protein RSOLAG1IB_09941 [Rhizoctonia solani AG-1 IB]